MLDENYRDSPDGVPGNDDAGAMSSWAVLTMMGLYSVDPTSQAYEIVSPVFPSIIVHLQAPYQGTTFTITTTSNPATTPYIKTLSLNGRQHTRNWLTFGDITSGGTLRFSLATSPNKLWGAAPQDAPPSLSEAPSASR